MKAAQIAVGLLAFLGSGAASFFVTRALSGSPEHGAGSREGLVEATIEGVNAGDRDALLAIMVGPASDRIAAECDEEAPDTDARAARRAERVDDALDEAKRRRLVLDRIGEDHAEVVVARGGEIDKHCKARVDVVKHDMEIALHDGKDVHYTAHLTSIELGGHWYLAQLPVAMPEGAKPVAVAVAAAPAPAPVPAPPHAPAMSLGGPPAPVPAAAAPSPAPAAAAPAAAAPAAPPKPTPPPTPRSPKLDFDLSNAPGNCAAYVREANRLLACSKNDDASEETHRDLAAFSSALFALQHFQQGRPDALAKTCAQDLQALRQRKFGC